MELLFFVEHHDVNFFIVGPTIMDVVQGELVAVDETRQFDFSVTVSLSFVGCFNHLRGVSPVSSRL